MTDYHVDPVKGSDFWNGLQWTPANEEIAKYKCVWLAAAYGVGQSCGDVTTTGLAFEQQLEFLDGGINWMINIADVSTYNPNPALTTATLGVSATLKAAIMCTLKAAGTTAISDISAYTAPAAETDQSIDLSAPAGIQDDDIMLAIIIANASATPTITPPAGWALVGSLTPTATRISVYWKRCSSESGSYTFSHNQATNPKIMGAITAYRNCITTGDPYDKVSATGYVTSNTSIRAAAITGGTVIAGPKATCGGIESAYALVGGDEVKMRTAYHSSATIGMTAGSRTLNLPAGSVKLIDDCESGWTQSANITAAHVTNYAYNGTYCLRLTPAAAFGTGKMAYKTLPSTLDLSTFKAISFWAYLPTKMATDATESYQICLCSDNSGDTPVATFIINGRGKHAFENEQAFGSYVSIMPWYCDLNAAIGEGINSIAVYAITDPGTTAIYFENFVACGSVLSEDTVFCHDALIKEGAGLPIYDIYVFSADDTALIATAGVAGQGCYKTDASVDVEVFVPLLMALTVGTGGIISNGTSATSLLKLSGGWNPDTDEQDGITYHSCPSASGIQTSPYWTAKTYMALEKIGCSRLTNGWSLLQSLCCTFDDMYATRTGNTISGRGNTISNIYMTGDSYFSLQGSVYGGDVAFVRNNVENIFASANSYGIYFSNACKDSDVYNVKSWYSESGLYISYDAYLLNIRKVELYSPRTNCLRVYGGNDVRIYNLTIDTAPANGLVTALAEGSEQFYKISIYDLYIDSLATVHNATVSDDDSWRLNLVRINDDPDDNRFYFDKGSMVTQTATRHTAEGTALKFTVRTGVTIVEQYPKRIPLGIYYVPSGASTISLWVRKDDASCGLKAIIPAYQIQEATPTDKEDSMSVGADEWEQLSLSLTTLEAGVVELYADVWGAAGKSIFIDDIEIS